MVATAVFAGWRASHLCRRLPRGGGGSGAAENGRRGESSSDSWRACFSRFVPNDPYFAYSASNAGYQWHLRNTGSNGAVAGIDVNVVPAWDAVQGTGFASASSTTDCRWPIPNSSPNVDTINGYDWNGGDSDPSPGAGDNHGTACAGVAAARGNNALGVSGAAPQATLVGLRLTSALVSDSEERLLFPGVTTSFKSKNSGPDDDGNIVEGPGALAAAAALADAATNGRGGDHLCLGRRERSRQRR